MIRHHSIFFKEFGTFVKLKVLSPDEIERFLDENKDRQKFDYSLQVLRACVFNLETEIYAAITQLTRLSADNAIKALFNGCIMLNPSLGVDEWVDIAYSAIPSYMRKAFESDLEDDESDEEVAGGKSQANKVLRLTSAKLKGLERHLRERVIGQDEAIDSILRALKIHSVGLNDEGPISSFMFIGPSGSGKTLIAKELHSYLFGDTKPMLRVDFGEYQHKHENQKLLGSPPGFVGFENGGIFSKLLENPNCVVLLDEVEKAHPDIFDTLLKVIDEGSLTDNKGKIISFKNTIVIMTSNLGSDKLLELIDRKSLGFNASINSSMKSTNIPSRESIERKTHDAMRKFFKIEFLNRIDSIVMFNFPTLENAKEIAVLQLEEVNQKLGKMNNIRLVWNQDVVDLMVSRGYNTVSNARGIREIRKKDISDVLSGVLIDNRVKRGNILNLIVSSREDGTKYFDVVLDEPAAKPRREMSSDAG